MPKKRILPFDVTKLRDQAEARLEAKVTLPVTFPTDADTKRLLHELQVHQIELELQNTELQEARDELESQLGRYTDLYNFAPVGYFSVDERGLIVDVNLTGSALLGVERSRLIGRRLSTFVTSGSLRDYQPFLKRIFTGIEKQICVLLLQNENGATFWADLQATPATLTRGITKWCRVVVSDLTTLKRAEGALQRMESLAMANQELKLEIAHRETAEASLKKSEEEAHKMKEQLRYLSHQLLFAQEEERKRISRELHDEVIQALVVINIDLGTMAVKAPVDIEGFKSKISGTQRMVQDLVATVHRFARELRPTVLDDLGLIPALKSYIKEFTKRTQIHVQFTAPGEVEQLNSTQRTVIYRVAQSALSNVEKHARASHANVSLQSTPGAFCLEIHDNGKSFNTERVLFAKRHKRLGLLGSRERVEMVGGTLQIQSAPGQGTTVIAKIPVAKAGSHGKPKPAPKSKSVK